MHESNTSDMYSVKKSVSSTVPVYSDIFGPSLAPNKFYHFQKYYTMGTTNWCHCQDIAVAVIYNLFSNYPNIHFYKKNY